MFPKYILSNKICRFCNDNRIITELQKELSSERLYRKQLEEKVNVLEARLNSISDKQEANYRQTNTSNSNEFINVRSKNKSSKS